jgi:hypothetical protein
MNFRFSTCALLCASLFLSCHSNPEEEVTVTVPYTFEVFSTSTGSLDDLGTRGVDNSEARNLLVVDIKDDKLVQKKELIDKNYYNIVAPLSLDLTFGKHKICFLASSTSWAEFDEQTFQAVWNDEKPLGVVWGKVVEVNVKQGDKDGSQQVVLERVVAYVRTTMNDKLPDQIYSIRQVLQGGSWTYDILHETGGVASQISFENIVASDLKGQEGKSVGIFTFVPDGTTTATSYTVTAYDEQQNVLQSHTFNDVPLVQNQYTNYKGNFFSVTNQCIIQIDKPWKEDNIIEY